MTSQFLRKHYRALAEAPGPPLIIFLALLAGAAAPRFRALHHLADRFFPPGRSVDRGSGDPSAPFLRACETGCWFLHRKQLAHPGVDLNAALLRLCENLRDDLANGAPALDGKELPVPPGRTPIEVLDSQIKVLETLKKHARGQKRLPLFADDMNPLHAKERHDHRQMTLRRLMALRHLPTYVDFSIERSRAAIIERFREVYGQIVRAAGRGQICIVSHGYSKTVREVVKRSLQGWDGPPPPSRPLLFLLETREEERFDTHLMEFELKRETEDRQALGFRNIAVGPEKVLLGLLERNDAVIFLLGAECFDERCRVVHPRGSAERIGELVDKLVSTGKMKCWVVVVAESYKQQKEPLTDTSSFDDHLDRVTLFSPEEISFVVSDRGYIEGGQKKAKGLPEGLKTPPVAARGAKRPPEQARGTSSRRKKKASGAGKGPRRAARRTPRVST